MTLLVILLGLVALLAGAEVLVRGASRLAAGVGITPLVIGLTVVAYGTSMPEMLVSVTSSLAGQADIAVGNVVGSNIFNVLLILGLSALVTPLAVSQQLVRIEVPLMIGVSIIVLLLGLDGTIGRLEGGVCFAGVLAYTWFLLYQARKKNALAGDALPPEQDGTGATSRPAWAVNVVYIAAGLGLLVLGARWLVEGAVAVAQHFGVDELVIGLTIIAAGTSLPEVATSIIASVRGERDIAVGNVVGSNLFNIMGVLGLSSVVSPEGLPVSAAALRFDIPVMIAVAVACLPIFFTGHVIARWEGAFFLGYFVAYTLYLVLAAAEHAALPVFSKAMVWFVLPLTGLTLMVVTLRAMHERRNM